MHAIKALLTTGSPIRSFLPLNRAAAACVPGAGPLPPVASFRPRGARASLAVPLLLVALAVGFTLAAVEDSVRHGRLLQPPRFDDLGYMLDGAARLEVFQESDAASLVKTFRVNPPHSPYSTVEAFFSFLLFGDRDWAPYVGNAVLIFVFLVFAYRLARGIRAWHKACVLLILLSFPMLVQAVAVCRPDFASALLMTGGAFVLLGRPARGVTFVRAPAGQKLAAGALFGLAMLAKPSVFPAHLAVLANCLLATALRDWIDPAARYGWRARGTGAALAELARAWAVTFVPLLLIAAPYFIIGGRQISSYIWSNSIGVDADIWKPKLDCRSQLTYYLDGPVAEKMLGTHRRVLLAVILAGAGFYAVRRQRRELLRVAAYTWVVAMAWAICTVNPMKHEFLGLTFQVPLVYLALLALRNMVLSQRLRRQWPWAEALLVAVTVLRLNAVFWPGWQGVPNESGVRAQWALVEQVRKVLCDHSPPQSWTAESLRKPFAQRPGPRVLLTFSGNLNSTLLNYLALQKYTPMTCYDLGLARTPEEYLKAFDYSDLVITCDPGMNEGLSPCEMGLVAPFVPNATFQDRILAALRERKDYVLAATVEYATNHKRFYVFQRK